MTVAELIAELQEVDGDRQVILAKDAEGNGYSPLRYLWEGVYKPVSTYSGEVGLETLTDDDRDRGYGEEDLIVGGQKAIVFYPKN